MSTFNSSGELNAASFRDAVEKIIKVASVMDANSSNPASFAPKLSESDRDEIIKQALLDDSQGKKALAQVMAVPIRKNLDYQGVARKAVAVDPLPNGIEATYDRDIDVRATIVSTLGAAPESMVFGERITIPTFTILSNPTVAIDEVRRRRFNVIDRAQQKARMEIQAHEDAAVFNALDFASDATRGGVNTVQALDTTANPDVLTKSGMLNLKAEIDSHDLVTAKYFLNIRQFTQTLNWESAGAAGASQVDPVTQRELLQTGLFGHIFGADIIVSKIVPVGKAFAVADPEFVGVMPVRQDIEVIPADEPKLLKLGWVVSEIVGIGIVNPRGVSSGQV